jgi:murein DD-endopeptidase MepM/ murein hydrolase activator NlpD
MRLKHRQKRSTLKGSLFALLLLCAAAAATFSFLLFFEGEPPHADFDGTAAFLNGDGIIEYQVSDSGSGIRAIRIWVIQGDQQKLLLDKENPRNGYRSPVGPREDSGLLVLNPQTTALKDGDIQLRMEVTDFSMGNWLAGNTTVLEKQLTIDTVPPEIELLHSEKYISPGGSGIVIYRLSENELIHGVTVNGRFSRGFPAVSGEETVFICYFGLPYDTELIEELAVTVRDKAQNIATMPFRTVLKKNQKKTDTITVSEGFLNRKIPEFQQHYPEMKGEFIDKYLYANSSVRTENNMEITKLCQNPSAKRYWDGSFARMAGSSRAGFADHRTYMFNGEAVDHQVHLGMDIASTRKAPVRAANTGKVVFGDYLGIYGNMVLLDHGQGVFSLYSHLSQINVSPGDLVDRDSIIGLTGTTGMAGGDHLHFSMLVHGIFVNPKEWWDKNWIEANILSPLDRLGLTTGAVH